MKRLVFLFCFTILGTFAKAQDTKQNSNFMPDGMRNFQFNLEKPAKRISDLQYDKLSTPLKGVLSPDGKKVILEQYQKGNRIKLNVEFEDGTSKEVTQSPCFIDPVVIEL
jgi:hypothetical protein